MSISEIAVRGLLASNWMLTDAFTAKLDPVIHASFQHWDFHIALLKTLLPCHWYCFNSLLSSDEGLGLPP
jgi:hypothetical protein